MDYQVYESTFIFPIPNYQIILIHNIKYFQLFILWCLLNPRNCQDLIIFVCINYLLSLTCYLITYSILYL